MLALTIFGERDGGRVEEIDGTHVETRYFHINFFPLVARSSILTLGSESYRIPTHRPSALAGYKRFWLVVLAVVAVGVGATLNALSGALVATLGVILFALWLRALREGRIGPDEAARRRVFRAVTGFSADPALVVHANPTLAEHLRVDLRARAERLAPNGYRDALTEWSAIGSHGGDVDVAFLALALTLSRIERRDDVHAAIWARLAPLAAAVPETITPLTNIHPEQPESAPQQVPMQWVPVRALDTAPGSLVETGFDVVVPRRAYAAPPLCASCLAPAELARSSFKGGHRVDVPYCNACVVHASQQKSGNVVGKVLTLGAAAVASMIAFVPGPSQPIAIALVAAAAAVGALGMAYLFPIRRAAAPATMTFDAARLVARDDETITLFCKNEEWSQRLAEHFGGTRKENRRVHPTGLTFAVLGLVGAPIAGGLLWLANNPKVRVDNGTGAPVAVWVDGRVVGTAPPTNGAETTDVRVPRGAHVVGWSPVGAASPVHTTKAELEMGGDYLVDPNSHHCYWVDAMVYGEGSTPSEQFMGARPVGLFHDFSFVHDWFVKSPERTEVSKGSKGTVRYAITRAQCDWVRSCPAGTREKYWNCLVGATEVGFDRCKADARKACGLDDSEE